MDDGAVDEENGNEDDVLHMLLGFAQALPPTWRAKDVVGNHGHLWGHEPILFWRGDGHVAQRAEKRNTAQQRSHRQFYPGLDHREA